MIAVVPWANASLPLLPSRSHAGCMQFFTSEGEFISDNGLTNAQQYFKIVRVGDGRFKGSIANKATDYGAPFKATNSLV